MWNIMWEGQEWKKCVIFRNLINISSSSKPGKISLPSFRDYAYLYFKGRNFTPMVKFPKNGFPKLPTFSRHEKGITKWTWLIKFHLCCQNDEEQTPTKCQSQFVTCFHYNYWLSKRCCFVAIVVGFFPSSTSFLFKIRICWLTLSCAFSVLTELSCCLRDLTSCNVSSSSLFSLPLDELIWSDLPADLGEALLSLCQGKKKNIDMEKSV